MMEKIGLGGGCHWCTEAVFKTLKGVKSVKQGWISAREAPAFSEAVLLEYAPSLIPMEVLLRIHLATHSSTSEHPLRAKYRSAVYAFTEAQRLAVEASIRQLQADYTQRIITLSLTFMEFRINTENYLNYYYKDPDRPFCQHVIAPKIRTLVRDYGDWIDPDSLV
jgi:peptide-methionine (S)-S-oxide reductase